MAQTNINIRMDDELKRQFDSFCSDVGMTMTTAFCVFAKMAIREQRIPFEIKADVPNARTIAAMKEADRISRDPNTKRYSSFSDIVADIDTDV